MKQQIKNLFKNWLIKFFLYWILCLSLCFLLNYMSWIYK